MLNEYMESLKARCNVTECSAIPKDVLEKEIDEVKGTIANERLWAKGSDGNEARMHERNTQVLSEYLEALEALLHGEEDSSFEAFLTDRNEMISNLADDIIRKIPGCEKYDHDMYFTAQVIDKAEGLLNKAGIKTCYPYYTEEDDGSPRVPCYRAGDCDYPDCIFKSKKPCEADNILDVLSGEVIETKTKKLIISELDTSMSMLADDVRRALV